MLVLEGLVVLHRTIQLQLLQCYWLGPTKVHLVKAMVFPVVMYGCESWTVKKAECQRIDAFELWYWRRLLIESLGLQGDPTSPL